MNPVHSYSARPPARNLVATRRQLRLAFALGFASALAVSFAHAEKGDREKPINYAADVGDVNYQTKIGTLSGNVVVTQGTLVIHADKIVMKQNPDNSLSATAYGNPVTFRQKRDGVDEYFDGYAQRVEYDGAKEFLQLFDRAMLRRGADEIRSNYISYNIATEYFKAEGRAETTPLAGDGGPGKRVRGSFQPKSESASKDAPKDAAKDAAKGAPKDAADKAPLPLKPAGEMAPAPAK